MKKITILAAFVLFAISTNAQEKKTAAKKEVTKEKTCCIKTADAKTMTVAEIAKCKEKCKAEGKKCVATTATKEDKKCCIKKAS
ncbi:hypothetical protein HNP99_001607 [Flavobacterium sp. 28A]|uniref:hypothetical protein n=1 Tax=Flavobacterium sp. 28A TaxID=2735895 RepID=UPI00156F44D2|nr:hypothetical protein [Flavobacterium sp. 28A]NRT15260.1 hypothetical protein [Flavobacterium sp. 28A]